MFHGSRELGDVDETWQIAGEVKPQKRRNSSGG